MRLFVLGGHVLEKRLNASGHPRPSIGIGYYRLIRAAGLMNEKELGRIAEAAERLDHRGVDAMSTLAAADHQHRETLGRRRVGRCGAGTFLHDLPSQRVAGPTNLGGVEPGFGLIEGGEDPVGQPSQKPVGDAR